MTNLKGPITLFLIYFTNSKIFSVLRFFRFNDPYRLLGVLIILIVISLPYFIYQLDLTIAELNGFVLGEALNNGQSLYVELVDDVAPLTAWVYGWVEWIFGRSITGIHLLALLIIFFQASYFAVLLISNKAYNENTYLPALIFGLLAFFSFDMLSFSPELLASTILLFALNNLFKEIEFRQERDEIVLNLGIYLGIASLIVFSFSVFLFGTIVVLILFTRLTFRKALLVCFGFLLPHLILITWYFFNDQHQYLFQFFYAPNFTLATLKLINTQSLLIMGTIPVVYFVFSLVMLNREAHFTKYQSQLLQVMFLWLAIAFFQIIITRERTAHSFFTFLPPLAYFISHYLLLIRRKLLAEAMLWVLIIGLVTMASLTMRGKISSVNYSAIFPETFQNEKEIFNKRILVLKKDNAIYQQNYLAGYFLDWDLSSKIFEHPEYFENITLIERSFQKDAPQIIVDDRNLMKPIFDRLPNWKDKYQRKKNVYIKISN